MVYWHGIQAKTLLELWQVHRCGKHRWSRQSTNISWFGWKFAKSFHFSFVCVINNSLWNRSFSLNNKLVQRGRERERTREQQQTWKWKEEWKEIYQRLDLYLVLLGIANVCATACYSALSLASHVMHDVVELVHFLPTHILHHHFCSIQTIWIKVLEKLIESTSCCVHSFDFQSKISN